MITAMLVDHDPEAMKELRDRLSNDEEILIVGEAHTSQMALQMVQELKPDVVLIDLEMPRLDGVKVAEIMHSMAPATSVVLIVPPSGIHSQTLSRASLSATLLTSGEDDSALFAAIHGVVVA